MKVGPNLRKILVEYGISSFIWAGLLIWGGPLQDMETTLHSGLFVNMILYCIGEGLVASALGASVGTLLFSAALSVFHSQWPARVVASPIALVLSAILGFSAGTLVPETWGSGGDVFLQLRLAFEAGITGYTFAMIGLLNYNRSAQSADEKRDG